jgi:crotonobetainyl-CoA:carnitine CoA-transferase CaiB-like acyl-CoA transferase
MSLLSGMRILDLSIWRPGPYATQLLAEIGADVVKVEPPGGDPMRRYPELFASLNANKRSIVVDLKARSGRSRVLGLAAEADVVIEGFRPGVADRLGVGYGDVRAVNPTVIYCSISGMGQAGPLALAPGHDLNYLAWSGALGPEGGSPAVPAVPVADLASELVKASASTSPWATSWPRGRARPGRSPRVSTRRREVCPAMGSSRRPTRTTSRSAC